MEALLSPTPPPPAESPEEAAGDQESEDDLSASRTSLERQAPHRGNTMVHVCWHRNTSVSMVDFSVAVEVGPGAAYCACAAGLLQDRGPGPQSTPRLTARLWFSLAPPDLFSRGVSRRAEMVHVVFLCVSTGKSGLGHPSPVLAAPWSPPPPESGAGRQCGREAAASQDLGRCCSWENLREARSLACRGQEPSRTLQTLFSKHPPVQIHNP